MSNPLAHEEVPTAMYGGQDDPAGLLPPPHAIGVTRTAGAVEGRKVGRFGIHRLLPHSAHLEFGSKER
jgi:hypothetical protein